MDFGAAMPMRTLEPETSITSMTTSSPSMTFSPGRRVMMSMERFLLGAVGNLERCGWVTPEASLRRDLRGIRKQWCAHGSVGSLVDDLVARTLCDQDRRAEVRAE